MDKNWERYRNYGRSKGLKQEDAEDFATEYYMRVMQGKKQTLKQYYIDYLRRTFGDTRTPSGKLKSNSRRFGDGEAEGQSEVFGGCDFQHRGSLERSLGDNREIRQQLTKIRNVAGKTSVACFLLFKKFGLSLQEIADVFGVSESRISQRTTKVEAAIAKIKRREESRMERLQAKKTCGGPRLGEKANCEMEKRKPRKMEINFQTRFNEWLT